MLGIPVALGMFFRHRSPARAIAFEARVTRIATVLFVLIVIGAVVKNWTLLLKGFSVLAPVAVTLNVAMLLIGFGVAWAGWPSPSGCAGSPRLMPARNRLMRWRRQRCGSSAASAVHRAVRRRESR